MTVWVLLLRGVNVGGKNSLPMAEFRDLLQTLGYEEPRTYIQSGNALFGSDEDDARAIGEDISAAISREFGFRPSCLALEVSRVRTARERCPFEDEGDGKTVHFFFLAEEPDEPDLEAVSRLAKDTERFSLEDGVFYLSAPDGIGRSKLAQNVEAKLGVPVTARNLRTVDKLIELAT